MSIQCKMNYLLRLDNKKVEYMMYTMNSNKSVARTKIQARPLGCKRVELTIYCIRLFLYTKDSSAKSAS